jgi:hypothetical protein
MKINNIFESKVFRDIVLIMAVVIVLVFIFGLGVLVGTKKAEFSFMWADQYHRNFGGPEGGFLGGMKGERFAAANGVFGQIIKINNKVLVIKGIDNVEKIVVVNDNTVINFQRISKKISNLRVDDNVVVIGEPNSNGQIEASLIRVLPPPPISFELNNHKPNNF